MNNVLVIDDLNNSSISYKKSDIDSEMNVSNQHKLFISYIEEAIQKSVMYEQSDFAGLIHHAYELHNIFNFKYIVYSPIFFDAFYNISLAAENAIDELIEMSDIHCFMSIINNDNTESAITDISENAMFLKVTNPDMSRSGNELLIALNNNSYVTDTISWQESGMKIGTQNFTSRVFSQAYYKGYEDSQSLLYKASNNFANVKIDLPALEYCNNLKIVMGNTVYQGYLPSVGQLYFLHRCQSYIKFMQKTIAGLDFPDLRHRYWTSTEFSCDQVWTVHDGSLMNDRKIYNNFVVPGFKKIKNEING